MKFKAHTVKKMQAELSKLIEEMVLYRSASKKKIKAILPVYKKSAENLLMYIAFRKKDHTKLQKRLGYLGLSRLARAEGHILSSTLHNRMILRQLLGQETKEKSYRTITIKEGEKLLAKRTDDLLGLGSKRRRLRIMVTLPSEASENMELINSLVDNGMNVARINCAHDSKTEWIRMIHNVRAVAEERGKNIKIAMDLAGPKIRTGKLKPGQKVMKISPAKDEYGNVINPATVVITRSDYMEYWRNPIIVHREDYEKFEAGQVYSMKDTSGKARKINIVEIKDNYIKATVGQTTYFQPGSIMKIKGRNVVIKDIPAIEKPLVLHKGEVLELYKNEIEGEQAQYNANGVCVSPSKISCTEPKILESLKKEDKVYFDDGKITGEVLYNDEEKVGVEITNAKVTGSRLKADKGINIPQTEIPVAGLTEKDREDLKFVAAHADIINFSFVNSAADVKELQDELKALKARKDIGIVLKIETQTAYNSIADILLKAMESYPIGVMIARGDLAVETGWNHIGIVQKELLSVCNAAHVPVIWATQVLENLAKKGLPSRSEITDAVTAIKADCVMLNKGPYISSTVNLLDEILTIQQSYQFKNAPFSPQLEKF